LFFIHNFPKGFFCLMENTKDMRVFYTDRRGAFNEE
jgi:hypothetical protein